MSSFGSGCVPRSKSQEGEARSSGEKALSQRLWQALQTRKHDSAPPNVRIIYGVPIRFDLANFHDHFGDELLGVCRYNKRGTTEPTETVELVFDSIDTARGHYNRGHIYCWKLRRDSLMTVFWTTRYPRPPTW